MATKLTKAEQFFMSKVPGLMAGLMKAITEWGVEDAAAAFGNAGGESAGFTKLQEIAPTVKGSRGGFGYFQWTGPRRRAYEVWCKKNKFDPKGEEANLGYLIVELLGSEKATVPAVRDAEGLAAKVKAFEVKFERPGIPHTKGRIRWANLAMQAWNEARGEAPPVKTPPPAKAGPDKDLVARVQTQLLALGYTEVGAPDGKLGGMTKAAILLFREDNSLPLTTAIDDALLVALAKAPKRVLVPGREDATEKTITDKVPEAKSAWYTKITGLWAGGIGGVGIAVKGVLENIPVVKDYVEPVFSYVGDVPPVVWFAIFAGGGLALWWVGRHGLEKSKEAFRDGSRR